jgi:hypothetical protein
MLQLRCFVDRFGALTFNSDERVKRGEATGPFRRQRVDALNVDPISVLRLGRSERDSRHRFVGR